jgi:hypothetical protein
MASFLQEQQKQNIRNIIDNIHDTFARPITVYKEGQKVVIATTPSFNKLYKTNLSTSSVDLVQNSRTFTARIKYAKYQDQPFFQEGSAEKISLQQGITTIKVNAEAYAYMQGANYVEVDGRAFQIEGDAQPQGMFGPQYYKYTVTPTKG